MNQYVSSKINVQIGELRLDPIDQRVDVRLFEDEVKVFGSNKALKFQSLPDNYLMIDFKDLERNDIDTVIEWEVIK